MPTTSHRPRRRTSAIALAIAVTVAGAGCGKTDEAAEPSIPTTNMTPMLVLSLDSGQVQAEDGPRDRDPASLDPPTVAGGSIIEVRNDSTGAARLRAGTAFDTGVLEPGERTVVVVVNDTAQDRRWPLDDGSTPTRPEGDTGPLGTLVVTPRAAP